MRAAALLAVVLAGCLAPAAEEVLPAGAAALRVLGADGAPLPFAAATALGPAGPLALLSAGRDGALDPAALPAGTARVLFAAAGHAAREVALPLPREVRLEALAAPLAADDAAPALRFLPPVDLGGALLLPHEGTCRATNCGLSEPVLEVAGDGSVYVSGTCCIGKAPPVWASRDGGATFAPLPSAYREAVGIEGDFAVDDAGNVYFTDILLGAVWFTSWDKDGKERWTLPLPFPPLVDRPWVRAGAEDVVYFAYNTGYDTLFYRSTDGGRTWGAAPLARAGFNLGDLGQGPENERLYLTGDVGGKLLLLESADGGTTWSAPQEIPAPDAPGGPRDRRVPVADEAGNVWVVYAWGDDGVHDVYASRRDPGGAWHEPVQVSAPGGTHAYPWPAALKDGTLVVAWYAAPWANVTNRPTPIGASNHVVQDEDTWHVMVAASLDATAPAPSFQRAFADPEPVATGPLGRRLLDFLQVDVGPDGVVHLAYAADRYGASGEHTLYVRSTRGLDFAPAEFPYGPKPADGRAGAAGSTLRLR